MKIKRLEISGFKSFADKVVIDFQHGITGVVGPNGCGKSNIVDAIRWCMGEQSARNLRGKAMDDLIFAGSQLRKPLGMAEVSLVFSTEDGLAPAKYLAFNEIQLTRRLYRDGTSEYLINKTICRLMDITELFMDTGVGTKAYSIIEQGKIGQILHSRPEERRFLIEEAAGVTKFKSRKQMALRKIETTKHNLVRLADVLGEIKRQLAVLQKQAVKAEKFCAYRDELRDLDQQFMLKQAETLQEEQRISRQNLAEIRDRLQLLSSEAGLAENRAELQRFKMLEAEKEHNQQHEELFMIRSEVVGCESRLSFIRKESARVSEKIARLDGEAGAIIHNREALDAELAELEQKQQLYVTQLKDAEILLEKLHGELNEQEQTFGRLNRWIDSRQRELRAATGSLTQNRTRQESALKRLAAISERIEQNSTEKQHVDEKLEIHGKHLSALEADTGQCRQKLSDADANLKQLQSEEAELKERLPGLEHKWQSQRDASGKAGARLASLQELEQRFTGYGGAVRVLMTEYQAKEGFLSLLADILTVPEQYEIAIEAVLGDRLQTILCSNQEVVFAALEYLTDKKAGRAFFASAKESTGISQHKIDGATSLATLVTVPEKWEPLVSQMLGSVFLVETIEKAMILAREHSHVSFVTETGEIIHADGTIRGGSPETVQNGIISKKREIRTLEEQLANIRNTLETYKNDLDLARGSLDDIRQKLQSARNSRHKTELELNGLLKDRQQLDAETARFAERLQILQAEKSRLDEEQKTLLHDIEMSSTGQASDEQLIAQLEAEMESLETEKEDRLQAVEAAREDLTSQRILVAKLKEQADYSQRTLGSVAGRKAGLEQRAAKNSAEESESREELQRLEQDRQQQERNLQEQLELQRVHENRLAENRKHFEEISAILSETEQMARRLRDESESLRKKQSEQSIYYSETNIKLQNLEQSLYERYRTNLEELKVKSADRQFDETAAKNRRLELERLVRELGEVNLMAIEEYARMESRYGFLVSQKTDLEDSLQDLQQAIQRINRTTRKRFMDAFNLINAKFQEVFPKLFCGGKAELRLTDEQDLLETGIDIIVQPPGKKLSNVMLLSGGEKALSAVALIFAIFLIKPTPFCLLDEVDAPLDDANIRRFNDMVREMSMISQFIIITHNKATMSVADTLYGITMEEPGASRMVSVRLQ